MAAVAAQTGAAAQTARAPGASVPLPGGTGTGPVPLPRRSARPSSSASGRLARRPACSRSSSTVRIRSRLVQCGVVAGAHLGGQLTQSSGGGDQRLLPRSISGPGLEPFGIAQEKPGNALTLKAGLAYPGLLPAPADRRFGHLGCSFHDGLGAPRPTHSPWPVGLWRAPFGPRTYQKRCRCHAEPPPRGTPASAPAFNQRPVQRRKEQKRSATSGKPLLDLAEIFEVVHQ